MRYARDTSKHLSVGIGALALVGACSAGDGAAVGQGGGLVRADDPVGGEYIVVLREAYAARAPSVQDAAADLLGRYGSDARMTQVYEHTISGFAAAMAPEAARDLAGDPAVRYVEENAHVELWGTQEGAVWNLDRVDQRELPGDDIYEYGAEGTGVNVYVIDTGIRTTHIEFAGRAHEAFSTIDDGRGAQDCHGHGTHVAGTIGGAEWGVAKDVTLYAVRVFDCDGRGATMASVIEAVEWVSANAEAPAVANMSLGGSASDALDDAVARSAEQGVTYAVAAGNSGADACDYSPARAAAALTVGASAKDDYLAHFTNTGECVDLFAPGLGIDSAGIDDDTSRKRKSGTSMASPHVAGAAALYLETAPHAEPAQVREAVTGGATAEVLRGIGDDWPNLLLYTGFVGGGDGAGGR